MEDTAAESNLVRIEEEIRRAWLVHGLPQRAGAGPRNAEGAPTPFILCQQPLEAAGQSPAEQSRLLSMASLMARYQAMRGRAVHYQAGWSCHGLAVEVEVERALAAPDLEPFVAACRQAADEGVGRGNALAARLGVWLDPAGTYHTRTAEAVGAVWTALHRLWDAGKLRDEQAVAPVCPRCDTPLSTVEAQRRSEEAPMHSAWVRVPWDGEADAYFLVGTEAPWMLVGMTALALHPGAGYAIYETPGPPGLPPARLVLAEQAAGRALPAGSRPVRRMAAKALRGARYRPLFTFLPAAEGTGRVVLSTDVPVDEGTGILPVTPAFHAPSLAIAREHGLPVPQLLDRRGNLDGTVMPWRGLSPLDAEALLVDDLSARGLVVRQMTAAGRRAVCPHCGTPILPQTRSVWWIDTEDGRWFVGRDRAWGTPMPVWQCDLCGARTCLAGLDDLAHRAAVGAGPIDPHRPAVDRVTFPCADCGGPMRRVPAVLDAALDAAVVPLALAPQDEPADLAVGAWSWLSQVKQVAALLGGSPSRASTAWRRAISLPDAEPDPTTDADRSLPADAWRWAAYSGTTPQRAEERFLRPLWRLAGELDRAPQGSEPLLEQWLAARLEHAREEVTQALEAANPRRAAGELEALVDDLAGWYVPSAQRAQRTERVRSAERGGAMVETLARLVAPFVPHLAEALHRQVGRRPEDSVHLSSWPPADPSRSDPELLARMTTVRQLATLGQVARARAHLAPEQPTPPGAQAIVGLPATGDLEKLAPLRRILAGALGCADVHLDPDAAARVTWRLRLRRDQAGARPASPEVDVALASLEADRAAHMAGRLLQGLGIVLEGDAQEVHLLPEEVEVMVDAPPGWTAAASAGQVVILQTGDLPVSDG